MGVKDKQIPVGDGGKRDQAAARDKRLAAALKANLLRRKAPAAPAPDSTTGKPPPR
jgi:hypothetical protein